MMAPTVSYLHYPAGEEATSYDVGDFLLTHSNSFLSRCIRFGQRLRFRGEDRKYAFWNHAALIVDADGDLVEAIIGKGICKGHISDYADSDYTIVHTHVSSPDQVEILRFVNQTMDQQYGLMTIASLALRCLTSTQFSFGFNDQDICSGYVARAQERAGAYFGCFAENVMPADLAKYYDVVPATVADLAAQRTVA